METKHYTNIKELQTSEIDPSSSLKPRVLSLWDREKDLCLQPDLKRKFYERWGIELGLVENIFKWDRGVTMSLIDQGIEPGTLIEKLGESSENAKKQINIIQDHVETLEENEMAFIKGDIKISSKFIKDLHSLLLRNQTEREVLLPDGSFGKRPMTPGKFKDEPNNPTELTAPFDIIKYYCPPEDTTAEVITLCDLFNAESIQTTSPSVQASWLHHRFTQIHPFADGNGRVARTLASLIYLKAGLPPLIIRREEDRTNYLDSLEDADGGDLVDLCRLFINRQTEEMMSMIAENLRGENVSEAMTVARRSLLERKELRIERAQSLFHHIHAGAANKFGSYGSEINMVLHQGRRNSERFKLDNKLIVNPGEENSHYYDELINEHITEYKPVTDDVSGYIKFNIITVKNFILLIHLHERIIPEGHEFALVAFIFDDSEKIEDQFITLLPHEPLFIAIEESADQKSNHKMMEWAANAVELGMSLWARGI